MPQASLSATRASKPTPGPSESGHRLAEQQDYSADVNTPRDEPEPVPAAVLRVGDAERNSAIDALGEHLSTGRLTLDEYGDRSARVSVARTTADLDALFDDLPLPHPARPGVPTADSLSLSASSAVTATGRLGNGDSRSRAQKLVGAAAAGSVIVALALFFITGSWLWFLLIPGISAVASSIWGPDWREPYQAAIRGRARRRSLDGDRRRERRELRDR